MKYAITDEWMKCTLFSDVHSTAQCFFQIREQSAGKPRRRMRAGLDQ
jgi:hypothetical protein